MACKWSQASNCKYIVRSFRVQSLIAQLRDESGDIVRVGSTDGERLNGPRRKRRAAKNAATSG